MSRGLRVTGHPGRGSALWQAPSTLRFVHPQGLSGASPGPRANGHRWVWSSHSDVSSRFVRSRAQERRSVAAPVFSSRAPRGGVRHLPCPQGTLPRACLDRGCPLPWLNLALLSLPDFDSQQFHKPTNTDWILWPYCPPPQALIQGRI